MFDIGYSELLLIAVVALVVIGPKDLPRVMRMVGGWVGKGRAMTRHVRAGFDTMMREAELEEMQKQWAKQNEEIMRATPSLAPGDWMAVTDTPTPAEPAPVTETPAVSDDGARAAAAADAGSAAAPKRAAKPRAKRRAKAADA